MSETTPSVSQPLQDAIEALEPFARAVDAYSEQEDDDHEIWIDAATEKELSFTIGQLRRAREVLATLKSPPTSGERRETTRRPDAKCDVCGGSGRVLLYPPDAYGMGLDRPVVGCPRCYPALAADPTPGERGGVRVPEGFWLAPDEPNLEILSCWTGLTAKGLGLDPARAERLRQAYARMRAEASEAYPKPVPSTTWLPNTDYDNKATWPPEGHPLKSLFHSARLFPNSWTRSHYEHIAAYARDLIGPASAPGSQSTAAGDVAEELAAMAQAYRDNAAASRAIVARFTTEYDDCWEGGPSKGPLVRQDRVLQLYRFVIEEGRLARNSDRDAEILERAVVAFRATRSDRASPGAERE